MRMTLFAPGPPTVAPMLAYRHAFHAGNHADVLKHVVLVLVMQHMNGKDKGWRYIDTHAGAGGYSLRSDYARQNAEFEGGIGRLWDRADAPPALADYLARVREFNAGAARDGLPGLAQYPGSPALVNALRRPQDEMRLFELHPTDHRILASYLGKERHVEVKMADGFAALRGLLPPPTRRAVTLMDPSYELPADYTKVLAALRTALERFAEGTVLVWYPQVQRVEARQLPRRLQAAAQAQARKGWLDVQLSVTRADAGGWGMTGSGVFVANPPHTLAPALRELMPWLVQMLGRHEAANFRLEHSAS
jgi:23S rRNA (adenine2030-N6)-methyltransferase